MLLTSLITAAEETHTTEAAVSPIAVGGISLAVLLVMLIALLMFGKGREHSSYTVIVDAEGRQRIGFPASQLTSSALAADLAAL